MDPLSIIKSDDPVKVTLVWLALGLVGLVFPFLYFYFAEVKKEKAMKAKEKGAAIPPSKEENNRGPGIRQSSRTRRAVKED